MKKSVSKPPEAKFDRSASRSTATFVPFYWEAYNEIVESHIYDRYLMRRWACDLKPNGLAIVKTLRDRCYHNPAKNALRDTCEIDLDDLADAAGMSVATLLREFRNNKVLANFVERLSQYRMIDGKPRKDKNAYRVSMDTPIHPKDMEAYDALRARREEERANPGAKTIIKREDGSVTYKDQNDHYRGDTKKTGSTYSNQNDHHRNPYDGQNEQTDTTYLTGRSEQLDTTYPHGQNDQTNEDLPFGDLLTKDSLTPDRLASPSHKCVPPVGEGEPEGDDRAGAPLDALAIVWGVALRLLEKRVNKPTLEAHLRLLRLASCAEGPEEDGGGAVFIAPNDFCRAWVQSRCCGAVLTALEEAAGHKVAALRIVTAGRQSEVSPDSSDG